jgi:transporter family protein
MGWLIFALPSGLFFALAKVISRLFLKKAGNPLAFTAIHDFIAGIVLLPLALFNWSIPGENSGWLLFLGIVLTVFLSDWIGFWAIKETDVSLYQIICQARHIFVLFGGWLLFTESVSLTKLIAIVLIILGVSVALYQKSKLYYSRGILLTILSTFFAVVAFILVKWALAYFSSATLASLELMAAGILSYAFLLFKPEKISEEFKTNKWGLIMAGFLFAFFELFLFWALRAGEISRVIPVTQSSLVFGVLIGIIFLKEKERIPQKIIGTLLIIGGIIAIYYF